MDSTNLQSIITPGSTLTTQLNTRYGSGCTFNAKMQNVWDNYFVHKNSLLGPTDTATSGTGVLKRTLEAQALTTQTTSPGVFY